MPVHHPVEHHAQGIDVCPGAVVLPVGYLRRHIAIAAGEGAGGRLLGDLRNAEIPQLEDVPVGYHNVFRLDVPVDDILPVAGDQRAAHLDAQRADGILAVDAAQRFFQRKKQLHADVNVPADVVVVPDIADVIAGHSVRAAVQRLHQAVLAHQFFHPVFVVGGDAVRAEGLGIQLFDFPVVPGNGELFQGALFHPPAGQGALDLINPAEAPFADLPDDLPARPGDVCKFFFHGGSSLSLFSEV